ncbi:AAA family ATPase [Nocardia wallacei]|uniref:AAA family ATPase n=1 Tax=Nocardia wallacei TaxID=480035 RepID=UPI002453CC3F|nr:AAA family ATPase [Nocardia wallacei]
MTADDSTDLFAVAGSDIAPWIPYRMAAEEIGFDPLKPAPAGLELVSARTFGEPDHGLVSAASVTKLTGRTYPLSEIDKWYADHGLTNEVRAKQDRQGKAEAKQAAEKSEADADRADAEAKKNLTRRWAGTRFDAAALDPERSDWERTLASDIAYDNSQMAKSKPFKTTFAGSDAITAGATESELKALDSLTREQVLDLGQLGWALAEARNEETKARAKAILLERSGARTPLEDSMFDFERDFASLSAPEVLIPRLIESGTAVQVIAEPNAGKTFLATGWACDLASQGRAVIYVVADDSRYQYIRRVLGWCAAYDEKPREIFRYLKLVTRAAQFGSPADMDAVAAKVIEHEAVMVVFDTQHQCSEGIQENSNDDSHVVTAALVRLTGLEPGPAVVVVHHTGDGKTGRGAKSVHGFLTTVLAVSDVKEGGKRFIEVAMSKQKNMEKGKPVRYPLEYVEIPQDMRAGVVSDEHRGTLVARTRTDPFDTPGVDRNAVMADVLLYCILSALHSSESAMPVTRVAKYTREAARPMLGARGLLTPSKQLPRGFTDQVVSERLKAMANVMGGFVDSSLSTPKTSSYVLTSAGESELDRLAEVLGINSGNAV